MFLNLIIFILIFSSQAFAQNTSSLSLYNQNTPTSLSLNSSGGSGIDSNTELMLQLNNNITDESQNNLTVTNNSVTFSNTSPYFAGTYYGVFNGSSSYLAVPDESYFNFGSGNFTIDTWINFSTFPTSPHGVVIASKLDSGLNNGFEFVFNNTSGTYGLEFYAVNGGTQIVNATVNISPTPSTGTWYHVAAVRSSNTWYLFWNGTLLGTTATSGSIGTNTVTFDLGSMPSISAWFNGDMQGFRVSNIARWTSNFTPLTTPYGIAPVSQIVLQDTGTQEAKLWIDGNDSDKFKIDDSSATRLTIASGNVGIGTTSPGALLDVAGNVRLQTSLITNGTAPTISTGAGDCGTSPSVVGNDISGTVTVGSGTNGGQCTVTFSAVKSSTPNCICQDSTTASLTRAASQSTTSFVCTGTLTAGDKLVYWCPQ